MIAALEFQDLAAACIGAGKAHGVHVGLAAGADIAQLLGTGHGPADFLSQLEAGAVVGEERHAALNLRVNGFVHLRVAMAEDHRSGTDQIVDEFIAVLVDDPRAAAFPNEEIRFEIAEAAGRQHGAGTVCQVRH